MQQIKNLKWQGADQLAMSKCTQGVEPGPLGTNPGDD